MSMMHGQTHIKCTLKVFALLGCYACIVVSCRRFGATYRSHHQGSGNVSGILLGPLDPGRWDSKFVPKRLKQITEVLCVHIPRERRSHSQRGGSSQSRSNMFVDMKGYVQPWEQALSVRQTNLDWWTVSNSTTSQTHTHFWLSLSQEISIGKTTEHGISFYSTVKRLRQ